MKSCQWPDASKYRTNPVANTVSVGVSLAATLASQSTFGGVGVQYPCINPVTDWTTHSTSLAAPRSSVSSNLPMNFVTCGVLGVSLDETLAGLGLIVSLDETLATAHPVV